MAGLPQVDRDRLQDGENVVTTGRGRMGRSFDRWLALKLTLRPPTRQLGIAEVGSENHVENTRERAGARQQRSEISAWLRACPAWDV